MNGFEKINNPSESETIIATAEKFASVVSKDSAIPFLKEIESHLNSGEDFKDAMHKTMTRFKINWNDENYQSLAYGYKSSLDLIAEQTRQADDDYVALYREDILADAITHEENLTKDLSDN